MFCIDNGSVAQLPPSTKISPVNKLIEIKSNLRAKSIERFKGV